ncbi:hypothetical protein TVAG_210000 [Trichomonas vaginalis G3]|uniref:Uncharacterized protein n=1 Tax=Trichomonas vaginalis (strain ATCC PRA-98 / G3) TaxID=412133 RepID=A2DVQ7_TRIV3|nr:hypothetical protein TVAGG3_0734440 [Trichomonas vaginalis G3]EAY15470.1 hypothetical protein TVAG_210000 [Trichomonas vaginalis G3]KAI5511480.1 hypothetical protein TVAGG3_0734440 [Trichomonas vaginalis G3]|eukprot:XP_001327693.1 hypothetical protein [Trichomonas vaginalis G3]
MDSSTTTSSPESIYDFLQKIFGQDAELAVLFEPLNPAKPKNPNDPRDPIDITLDLVRNYIEAMPLPIPSRLDQFSKKITPIMDDNKIENI